MNDKTLTLAFAAGMLSTVNPCGFAMLPAYLGFFLGLESADRSARASVSRSLSVGLAVSGGFLLVFGVVGVVVHNLTRAVYDWVPTATIAIGAGLAVLGVAMLFGFEPVVNLPKLDRGGRTRDVRSMFLFGVSYAIASISCALPVFLTTVVGALRRDNLGTSVAVLIAYAAGMTLVLLALTVSLGLARQGMVHRLRQLLPYVNRVSGVLLVLAGAYLAHYGWYERTNAARSTGQGSAAVDTVTGWSSSISSWVSEVGAGRLGLLLSLGLCAVLTATFGFRARQRP